LKARGEYKPIYDTQPMLLAAAINDMYEGPELPYEQQVSQSVRSAGLPRATMPGMRPVSLMERNLEMERIGERVQRDSPVQGPMMGPPDPTPMQMRKMAVPMMGPQMDSPYEGNPSEEQLQKVGFISDIMDLERQSAKKRRGFNVGYEQVAKDMEWNPGGFNVGYEQVAKDMGYQPTQKTSESSPYVPYKRSELGNILGFASVAPTALAESDIGFDTPIGPAGTPEYMRRELYLPKTPSESGPQSATLAELRGNSAYDVGFRKFLQEREQYQSSQRPSIAEEEEFFKGGSMYAESARQRAIKDRDTASIEALGFAEGQEFAERETQSTVDRALRGGLRMEPTREDIAFMESVEETPPEML
jgi:hypothetical protein